MTDTINDVAAEHVPAEPVTPVDQQQHAERLVAHVKEQGVELVGPDGLLNQLTKRVQETALEAEISEHLGYDKHHPSGRNHGNSRNGVRSKTALTEIGPVEIEVPRDVDASFTPQIMRKPQRRLAGGRWGDCGSPPSSSTATVIVGHNSGKAGLRGTVGDLQN